MDFGESGYMIDKESLIAYFAKDRFATETVGIVIDSVEEESGVCRLILTDAHRNAQGAVMGGVSFTLGDFAFAVFANRHGIAFGIDPLSWCCKGRRAYCHSKTDQGRSIGENS